MLSTLILENFKAFGHRQVIPLAPITLIFGANSSGKSSILQSLLLLKQSLAQAGDENDAIEPQGALVDLGSYKEAVFNHEAERTIEIGAMVELGDSDKRAKFFSCMSALEPDVLPQIGIGIQIATGARARTGQIKSTRFYWNDPRAAAYEVRTVDKPFFPELHGGVKDSARYARVQARNSSHPMWQELYRRFMGPWNEDALKTLLRFAFSPEEVAKANELDVDEISSSYESDVYRKLMRAICGSSTDLTALGRLEEPEPAPRLLREITTPQATSQATQEELEADARARDLALTFLAATFGGEMSKDEFASSLGSPAPVVDQVRRIVECLRLIRVIENHEPDSYELPDLLGEMGLLQPDYNADRLARDPLLPPLRGFFVKRLLSLGDYCLESFVKDIEDVSNLEADGVTGSLRELSATVKSGLWGSSDLSTVLRALFENEQQWPWHWNLLPELGALAGLPSSSFGDDLWNLLYVGPLREYPERVYRLGGGAPRDVGESGKHVPAILHSSQNLEAQTNRDLQTFDVGYAIEVDRSSDYVFELRLRDNRSNTSVSIRDVGFGISQVLPVIVQSRMAQGRLILIEQPELHLHPRLQAELGTLFAESVAEQHNQFIIETHSEHLILRLQKLIREGQIKPSDVSVVYVMKGEDGSTCFPLRIDEEGDFIDEWPDGFFEEGYREMFE